MGKDNVRFVALYVEDAIVVRDVLKNAVRYDRDSEAIERAIESIDRALR